MRVNIKELIKATGEKLSLYPGKKEVICYEQPGKFKSHCVALDWRTSDTLKVSLLAGLSGKKLEPNELSRYPVSFQAETYLEVNTSNHSELLNEEDDDEEKRGSSGGGGKKPATKKRNEASLNAFDQATDGAVTEHGIIEKFVVMGKELAQEAFASAFENLKEQLSQTKIMAMDIMKNLDNAIQKVTPGGGLEAKGNENIGYKYNQERNAALFGAASP